MDLSCDDRGLPLFPSLHMHDISYFTSSPTPLLLREEAPSEMTGPSYVSQSDHKPNMAGWQDDTRPLREPVKMCPLLRFAIFAVCLLLVSCSAYS